MKPSPWPAVALLLALNSLQARADPKDALGMMDRKETFGAVVAPATLPAGASALYGFFGVPEAGAGYRQGFGGYELEARARFNYLLVSLAGEFLARYSVPLAEPIDVAPFLGLGVVGNSGSQYFDEQNFGYVGLRALGGVVVSYHLADTVRLLAEVDVPFDLPIGGMGGAKLTPVAGGGAELYLGNDVTLLGLGQLGVDVLKAPGGLTTVRLGYSVRLGLGFRVF